MIALAVGYQWFYNGANFLAFKVAGEFLHPLLVATLRFSLAALILLPFALSAWAALAFLVVASTLVGYAVFLALNAHVSPTLANTFNYAAPVVALFLSALLLHESLTLVKLVSGGVALVGVALMIDSKWLNERQRPNVAEAPGCTACSPLR